MPSLSQRLSESKGNASALSSTPSPSSSVSALLPVPSLSVSSVSAESKGTHLHLQRHHRRLYRRCYRCRHYQCLASQLTRSALSSTPSPSSSVSALLPVPSHQCLASQLNPEGTHLCYLQRHHHRRLYRRCYRCRHYQCLASQLNQRERICVIFNAITIVVCIGVVTGAVNQCLSQLNPKGTICYLQRQSSVSALLPVPSLSVSRSI